MKPTRRTFLQGGLAGAVLALLGQLPRTWPGTGTVDRPEFGGPVTYRGQPWRASLHDVAGKCLGRADAEILRSSTPDDLRRELVFFWPHGTLHGTAIEVRVVSPVGQEARRMFSPLCVTLADSLKVSVPLLKSAGPA